MATQYDELPEGDTFTGDFDDVQVGDYVKASVHGYTRVARKDGRTLVWDNGGSESGYPYARPIHRPTDTRSDFDRTGSVAHDEEMHPEPSYSMGGPA